MKEKKLDSQLVYQGRVLSLKLDTVELPNGRTSAREVVVHPGAIAVAAINGEGSILLIRQFRYPVGEIITEIPAGKLERGEDPLLCAQRELAEETGLGARNWRLLSTFFTTPGFCDEVMYLYLAEELYPDPRQADDDEFIDVFWVPLKKAAEMVRSGEIKDLKTIAGLSLVQLNG